MTSISISFLLEKAVSPELKQQIDALDHLAFAGDDIDDDPEFSSVQWASHDWMVLGFLDGELVTQLCLPKREITVGSEKVWVAGIGGMATHPDYQHKGYGSALLRATESFMRDEIRVPFGLLICADSTRPFYELARWQHVANALYYRRENKKLILHTSVMILKLNDQQWPAGEIDLCGSPW
jgi:aminoglycoside 2'-N-acetyltransferase I